MQSKPTKYNGYNFRSRTEARWAVFFDALGIKYHYEHEDFMLSEKERYLPDFWLPGLNSFAEVKGGSGFSDDEMRKCGMLCVLTSKNVLLLSGPPDFEPIMYFPSGLERLTVKAAIIVGDASCVSIQAESPEEMERILKSHIIYNKEENDISYWHGADLSDCLFYPEQNRLYVQPNMTPEQIKKDADYWQFSEGIYASRAARFEF